MEVFDAVRTVLAIRRYHETPPVPPDLVYRIVEAGRLTGSSMNLQPWHFIVVQDRDMLRRLGALARTGPYIAQAPLAIVVAIERTKYAVSAASRAISSRSRATITLERRREVIPGASSAADRGGEDRRPPSGRRFRARRAGRRRPSVRAPRGEG